MCSLRRVQLLVVLLAVLVWVSAPTSLAAPVGYPPQPQAWKMVTSPVDGEAPLYSAPGGEILAQWPDGTMMGLFGDELVDGGAIWVRVQDPLLSEGWITADYLTTPPVPVETSTYLDFGGVKPIVSDGRRECPPGFPVKGIAYGRNADLRVGHTPDDPHYGELIPSFCFRTTEEARAWGYITWQESIPGKAGFPTPGTGSTP